MTRAEQTAFSFLNEPSRNPERILPRPGGRAAPRVAQGLEPRKLSVPTPELDKTFSDDDELEARRQRLEQQITAELPHGRLALAVTDNRYTMISVKREKGLYRLRLHRMFLEAEPEVVRALGLYVGENDRTASTLLGRFIDGNQHLIRRARRRRTPAVTLEAHGEVHDLQRIYQQLNARYFADAIEARITWGQRPLPGAPRRRRSSIKMGSYSVEDRLIRIHPSLDRPFVPPYFVAWIVYHEMLHQKHAIPVVGGRRQFHTPAFLADEAAFDHYDQARRWERENLNRLLVY